MSSTTFEPRVIPNEQPVRNPVRTVRRIVPHALVIVIVVLGALFAHEIGHALVAQFFGARIVLFNVLGVQWYPKIEWMPQYGFGGYVYWFAPVNLTNHRLIMMAGSNFTLLLASGAVMILSRAQPRGLRRTALVVMSLYYLDSLLHALPATGMLPLSWSSRFTRSFSEAYFAAVGLGIPGPIYLGALVVVSLVITVLLLRALRK